MSAQSPPKEVWSRPDNPFVLSYIVYHHFRSLGWVVKNGSKFCVDYLLYKRGPVFSHAEFAVLVIPEYTDPADAVHSPFGAHHNEGDKSWVWFSMVNRVNSQVQKVGDMTNARLWSLRMCLCRRAPNVRSWTLPARAIWSLRCSAASFA